MAINSAYIFNFLKLSLHLVCGVFSAVQTYIGYRLRRYSQENKNVMIINDIAA
jgi:hypothetical protein